MAYSLVGEEKGKAITDSGDTMLRGLQMAASLFDVAVVVHTKPYHGQSHWNGNVSNAVSDSDTPNGSAPISFSAHTNQHQSPLLLLDLDASTGTTSVFLPTGWGKPEELLAGRIHHAWVTAINNMCGNAAVVSPLLNLISREDRDEIHEWNCLQPVPVLATIQDLFRKMVRDSPSSTAIYSWDGQITYAKLDEMTEILAHHLKTAYGVCTEVLVPFCFHKSMWVVVATLATLKAGGVPVALNPDFPMDRLNLIVELSEPKVILMGESTRESIPLQFEEIMTISDATLKALEPTPAVVESSASPRSAALIQFTSGTTGIPKGIILEHRSFCTSVKSQAEKQGLNSRSRVLQFSACSFDGFLQEIFTTLTLGACICIPSDEMRMDDIGEAIRTMAVNWTFMTPTLVRTITPAEVPCLETLAVGGEPSSQELIDTWADELTLINAYGPSEATILSTAHHWSALPHSERDPSSIGSSLPCCTLWVVSCLDDQSLAPIGAIGELFIQGPTLARGYLKNPSKTASSFVQRPQWVPPHWAHDDPDSCRFYRTGDLVKYSSDGRLHYLGRIDQQVKLRGQRIELQEIEQHMKNSLPSSLDAGADVVRVKNHGSGHGTHEGRQILCAFEWPSKIGPIGQTVDDNSSDMLVHPVSEQLEQRAQKIRTRLENALPPYMVPQFYISLRAMPTNPSGKLDRRRLSEIVLSLSEKDLAARSMAAAGAAGSLGTMLTDHTLIENETQLMLRNSWAQLLPIADLNTIRPTSSFFQLGGDSVSAIMLSSAMRKLGWRLSVIEILGNPTLASQADLIRPINSHLETTSNSSVIESATEHSVGIPRTLSSLTDQAELAKQISEYWGIPLACFDDMLPATYLQRSFIALTQRKSGCNTLQQVFKLEPGVDVERVRSVWNQMTIELAILRTVLVYTQDNQAYQVVLKSNSDLGSPSSLWHVGDDSLSNYLNDKSNLEFGYTQRLCRLALLRGDGEDRHSHYLVWTAHHATYDAWSDSRLMAIFTEIYETNSCPVLSPFRDFVEYVERTSQSSESKMFWRNQLSGFDGAPFPVLPTPDYRPITDDFIVKTIRTPITSHDEVTLPTMLRAAWALTVSSQTSAQDVTFGSVTTGRTVDLGVSVSDVVNTVGPCIAVNPVRVTWDDGMSISELLSTLHHQWVDMIPHEHFGMQNIEKLDPEARAACQFQNFLLVHPEPKDWKLPTGISLVSAVDTEWSGFGLAIAVSLGAETLKIEAAYDSNVIRQEEVLNVLQQFEHFLCQLTTKPGMTRLGQLDRVCSEQRQKLLEWNTYEQPKEAACIHWLITRQMKDQPDRPALTFEDDTWTYGELDGVTSLLANYLRLLGIGPGVVVPILFPKSVWAVAAVISVLRAGGACTVLDTTQSARCETVLESLQPNMVLTTRKEIPHFEDRVQSIVCVDDDLISQLSRYSDEPTFRALVAQSWSSRPLSKPTDMCWLQYTSGSTGVPKGVMIEHRAVAQVARNNEKHLDLRPSSRVLQFAAFSFDVSIEEICVTLMTGGCVCIASEHDRLNDLIGCMNRMQVTWADLTPTVARAVDLTQAKFLETLVLGGELLTKEVIRSYADDVALFNTYGPAECTIYSTVTSRLRDDSDGRNIGRPAGCACWIVDLKNPDQLMPIGAIGSLIISGPNVSKGYFGDLDRTNAVFFPGSRLGWATDLDMEFETCTFYSTGDLARWLPDGTLEFAGRVDGQVKIHGQRVELGEIEHVLQTSLSVVRQGSTCRSLSTLQGNCDTIGDHPKPTASVAQKQSLVVEVIQLDGRPGSSSTLVTFLPVDHSMTELTPSSSSSSVSSRTESRLDDVFSKASTHEDPGLILPWSCDPLLYDDCLETRLLAAKSIPEYMVPTMYLPLSHIPKTNSDKVDRRALRKLAQGMTPEMIAIYSLSHVGNKVRPRDANEQLLVNMWAELLGVSVENVGVDDGFFRLGGDSVMAIRMVSMLRKSGFELAFADIFLCSSLAHLSTKIRPIDRPASTTATVETDAVHGIEFPRSLGPQEALATTLKSSRLSATPLQRDMIELSHRNKSANTLEAIFDLDETVDLEKLKESWEKLYRDQEIFRTRLVPSEHIDASVGDVQQIVDADEASLELPWTEAASVEDFMVKDRAMEFGIGTPLNRFGVIIGLDGTRSIVWRAHHATYDGWSTRLVARMITDIYTGRGIESNKPPPFSDLIAFSSAQDPTIARAFWEDQMAGYELSSSRATFPTLPSSRYHPLTNETFEHQFMAPYVSVPNAPKSTVSGNCVSATMSQITMSTILRAAWALVIAKISHKSDVIFGAIQTGRLIPIPGIEEIVGPCITLVPVRVNFNDDDRIIDVLHSLHRVAAEMIAHEQVGLRTIGGYGADCKAACEALQSLLIVQPDVPDPEMPPGVMLRVDDGPHREIVGYALSVECSLGKGQVTIHAHYDTSVLEAETVGMMMRMFEEVIQTVSRSIEETTVGDILALP
ncbi:Non-ribosomal peptide synthetase [Gnomoniopsis sp. IMI 355080]|nr:Non-ribosomal peptide synthetase [Gnomoniopsis sp. IMI 355080]